MPADLIIDIHGNERACGSLVLPPGFVQTMRSFEQEKPILDDASIRALLTDPDRPKRRKIFDWKWIQNQYNKGSCNGYAEAGGLGKARWLRGIKDGLLLSGAFAYSLMNNGQDHGSVLYDGMIAVEKYGICSEELVPWDQIYPYMQPANARSEAAKHKGLKAYPVQTKQGFRTAVAVGFPVIVCVHAGNDFQHLNSQGICGIDNGSGNHAVHVDDGVIIGGDEVYDLCNSWGVDGYGDQGRSYARWESFEQCFPYHVFYAIASTEEYGI